MIRCVQTSAPDHLVGGGLDNESIRSAEMASKAAKIDQMIYPAGSHMGILSSLYPQPFEVEMKGAPAVAEKEKDGRENFALIGWNSD